MVARETLHVQSMKGRLLKVQNKYRNLYRVTMIFT